MQDSLNGFPEGFPDAMPDRLADALKALQRRGCACLVHQDLGAGPHLVSEEPFRTTLETFLAAAESENENPAENLRSDFLLNFCTQLKTLAKSIGPRPPPRPTQDPQSDPSPPTRLHRCRTFLLWQLVLRRLKFRLLHALKNLARKALSEENEVHLARQAGSTFAELLLHLPCPVDCRQSCRRLVRRLASSKANVSAEERLMATCTFRALFVSNDPEKHRSVAFYYYKSCPLETGDPTQAANSDVSSRGASPENLRETSSPENGRETASPENGRETASPENRRGKASPSGTPTSPSDINRDDSSSPAKKRKTEPDPNNALQTHNSQPRGPSTSSGHVDTDDVSSSSCLRGCWAGVPALDLECEDGNRRRRMVGSGKRGRDHFSALRKMALSELRQHWRTSWVPFILGKSSNGDGCCCKLIVDDQVMAVYDVWECLVAPDSNMPFPVTREFVSCSLPLADRMPAETDMYLKRRQLAVLNRVLCYGQALGIQSEVPSEASEVAQLLLRRAIRNNFFDEVFVLPPRPSGALENTEDDNFLATLRSCVLLYFKAVAVVLRDAQAASSSSDESDCSSSAVSNSSSLWTGSGSGGSEAEREFRMIGENVLRVLDHVKEWACSKLDLPQATTDLVSLAIALFSEQDDILIEGLLCLLDCHTFVRLSTPSAPTLAVSTGSEGGSNRFDPLDGFESLLLAVSCDHTVLLDFLISNETCFLLYFLRLLKHMTRNPASAAAHPAHGTFAEVLNKLWSSITKLRDKALFPYEIAPVLKLLEKTNDIFGMKIP